MDCINIFEISMYFLVCITLEHENYIAYVSYFKFRMLDSLKINSCSFLPFLSVKMIIQITLSAMQNWINTVE